MDIAFHNGGLPQINAARGFNVTSNLAEDNNVANVDICTYACIWTDGQTALRKGDGSFDISVNVKIFIAGELSRMTTDLPMTVEPSAGFIGFLFSLGCCLLRVGLARTIPKLMP